ncbi:MAG TPA: 4Fe-4S binding protein [Anaerolineae bacterium]
MPEPIELYEETPHAGLSRRDFLKGAVVTGVAAGSIGGGLTSLDGWAGLRPTKLAEAVIFPDPTLCIGCLTCEVICSRVHEEQGLSNVPRIRIFNDSTIEVDPEILENYPNRGQFRQQPCLQCPTAECLYVCPVNAFQVEPESGARFIREDICVSCGRCANACPYPTYDESEATSQDVFGQVTRISYDPELDTFTKCDLCYWREEGPACVERCPVNIRIQQGIIESDTMCLDMPRSDMQTWIQLREFQTFPSSPAPQVEAS